MPGNNVTPLDGRPETPNEQSREEVKKYISKFTDRDLINIVQAARFSTFIPNKPSRDQLIDVATQAVLEMYTPAQIKKLLGKNKNYAAFTTKAVDQADAKVNSAGSKIGTGNMQSPRGGGSANNAAAIKGANEDAQGGSGNATENLQNQMNNGKDTGFSIDEKLAEALPGLKKKVIEILKLYPPTEQARIATVIGVKFKEGDAKKSLSTKLANYINFYVSLMLGKTKGVFNMPLTQAAIDEINKILEMTPFAYLTGKSSPSPAAIKALRKKAEEGKKMMDAMNKNMAARKKQDMFDSSDSLTDTNKKYKKSKIGGFFARLFGTKKQQRATANYFQALGRLINIASAPGKKESNLQTFQERSDDKDTDLTGFVFDKQKLIDIAESLNISDAATMSGMDPLRIADAIVKAMAAEAQDIQDELVKASKIKNKAERQKAMDAIAEREKNTIASQLENEAGEYKQDFSDKIPIVTFDAKGEIMSEAVLQAVPVYIVGQSSAGSQFVDENGNPLSPDQVREALDKKRKAEKDKNIQSSMTGEAGELTRELIMDEAGDNGFTRFGNWWSHGHDENYITRDENGEIIAYGASAEDIINENAKLMGLGGATQPQQNELRRKAPAELIGIGGNNNTAPTAEQLQNQGRLYKTAGKNQEVMQSSWERLRAQITGRSKPVEDDVDTSSVSVDPNTGRPLPSKKAKGKDQNGNVKISTYKNEVNLNSRRLFKNRKLKDVQAVYEISNYNEGIFNRLYATNDLLSSIVGITSQIPMLFTGLQNFGMSMNTEGVMAALATVQDIASTAAQITWMSTGGTAKGGNGQDDTSTILTGDPQTSGRAKGKANPELVSVDWKSKQIKVKPTQQYATSGTTTGKNKPVKHFATGGTMSSGTDDGNISDVKRYTNAERNAPMLVNMSSGLVKYSKTLDGVDDDGTKTAIKVYCVNSGINDKVKVGDTEISLMEAVAGLYATAASIDSKMSTNTQILTSIAAASGTIASNTATIATNTAKSGGDGFSFTSALDSILAGD